jgi:hypothetical protein
MSLHPLSDWRLSGLKVKVLLELEHDDGVALARLVVDELVARGLLPVAGPPPSEPKRTVDTDGAAEITGFARQSLESMRVRGNGPAYLKLGRRVMYRVTDLHAWMDAQCRTSTSDRGPR